MQSGSSNLKNFLREAEEARRKRKEAEPSRSTQVLISPAQEPASHQAPTPPAQELASHQAPTPPAQEPASHETLALQEPVIEEQKQRGLYVEMDKPNRIAEKKDDPDYDYKGEGSIYEHIPPAQTAQSLAPTNMDMEELDGEIAGSINYFMAMAMPPEEVLIDPSLDEEKKQIPPPKSSTAVCQPKPKIIHRPEEEGEAVSRYFPPELSNICLEYLGGDIEPTPENKTLNLPKQQLTYTIFGKNFSALMDNEATLVSNLILNGEEQDVEDALTTIKAKPDLLRWITLVTDDVGHKVQGTPLQIAAMAGYVDLKGNIIEQKNRGIVERLIEISNLSDAEVREQLQCITSKKACEINEQRNQKILDAIKRFGEGIIKTYNEPFWIKNPKREFLDRKANDGQIYQRSQEIRKHREKDLEKLQVKCKHLIDQLKKDLKPDPNVITTMGYIVDLKILRDIIIWYGKNMSGFCKSTIGEHHQLLQSFIKSDVFWINGIGELQKNLSLQDFLLVAEGIRWFVAPNNGLPSVFPKRKLIDSAGTPYRSSDLGSDYYFGLRGREKCYDHLSGISHDTRGGYRKKIDILGVYFGTDDHVLFSSEAYTDALGYIMSRRHRSFAEILKGRNHSIRPRI